MTRRSLRPARGGMTLVEMLVALAATLLLMTAIAQVFAVFGDAITGSRAVLDLDGRMRATAWRLRSDLAGATARTLPPLATESGEGYFEVIEGPAADGDSAGGTPVSPADHDDALLFTTRNTDTPFIGRAPTLSGTTAAGQADLFESMVAEVGWFARQTPGSSNPVTYTLYRKQLLVMGYVGTDPFHSSPGSFGQNNRILLSATASGTTYIGASNPITSGSTWSQYFNLPCDVSARLEISASGTALFPNTIADLTRREARFMHNLNGVTGGGFPFPFVDYRTASLSTTDEVLPTSVDGLIFDKSSQRYGEDVVLTNVIGFDVRVFDPGAPVVLPGGTPLVPGDPGFTGSPVASGAYVDLGNGVTTNSLLTGIVASGSAARFGGYGQAKSSLAGSATTRRTYDTWSTHYEANGLDEDGSSGVDQGTDGIDNDNDGFFDEPAYDSDGDGVFEDLGEVETLPPYPVPLRGIEVRIRCYEPTSRQVRQVTVRHTFVPH